MLARRSGRRNDPNRRRRNGRGTREQQRFAADCWNRPWPTTRNSSNCGETIRAQADLESTRNHVQAILADLTLMRDAYRHLLADRPRRARRSETFARGSHAAGNRAERHPVMFRRARRRIESPRPVAATDRSRSIASQHADARNGHRDDPFRYAN